MKRTVIVTGGTKGLGRETVLAFGRAGYQVVALYSADETAAQALRSDLAAANISGAVLRHDVCSDASDIWNQPAIQSTEHLVLIHNACAPFSPKPMHQLGWTEFEKNFLVAVKGAWSCSQGLIRLMVRRGQGTLVNVLTSALSGPPPKGFAAYLTAKHALQGFTLALAAEYAARGIKVFSVSPGFMDTPLTQQWDSRLRDAIRSGPSSVPNEAAARILALVEDAKTPGHGENFPV